MKVWTTPWLASVTSEFSVFTHKWTVSRCIYRQ